jgi:CDP-glycerol glycerophosphotransferase (TagB/SpsB family)
LTTALLLYGDSIHYIDHLAPLAILAKKPLLYTQKSLAKIFKEFYPSLDHRYLHFEDFNEAISQFDALITCDPTPLIKPYLSFASNFRSQEIRLIWTPHGNSDKGKHSYFMEALKEEKEVLVYGKKMVDFFKEKGVFNQLEKITFLGNYRWQYFQKYQASLVKKRDPTLLYAPTWHNEAGSKALLEELEMIKELSDYHWMIKLHPNTLQNKDANWFKLLFELEEYDHIEMVSHIPTIYPLLSITDLYIGDVSSIGYDFLTFDRPMLFLNNCYKDHISLGPLPLQKTGLTLSIKTTNEFANAIDYLLNNPRLHSANRRAVYNETFWDKQVDFECIASSQAALLPSFDDLPSH